MASAGLRVGVVGASGALGTELLELIDASSLPVSEIVAVATDRSLGSDVEFQGAVYPLETDVERLAGVQMLFVCTPPEAALDFVQRALTAKVPCIDLSGSLSERDEVPMRIAGYGAAPAGSPLIAIPGGASLAWALALQPLAAAAGLRRVVGTVLESAASGGRLGIEALYKESVALFNQQEPPEPSVFEGPVAFDCLPGVGDTNGDGSQPQEARIARELAGLLGDQVRIAATSVQVPAFSGQGSTLAVETERPLDVGAAADALRKAPGVAMFEGGQELTTRTVSGSDVVLVGRLRADPSCENGLLLWIAADPLRLVASHAVQLATLQLR
jgi:aspartate-semialdehyde dehydrogenase